MKCVECGAELADDALFCHKCGTKIGADVSKENGGVPENKNSDGSDCKVKICPECGAECGKDDPYCYCGHEFEDFAKAEEEKRKAEEAERQRIAEEKRKEEEAERQRKDEEKKKAEEAEQQRKAEEKRKSEEAERQRKAEEKQKAEAAELQRIVEEKRKFEEANKHPVILPLGTDGTAGKDKNYVLFGLWPQSIKANNVSIDESKTYNLNGWKCYEGSDGCYYVKETAKSYEENYIFSNGENMVKGNSYFFKMENIKWRVLDNNYQGGKLLLSEKILDAKCFYHDSSDKRGGLFNKIYPNNYEHSDIRQWLNSTFATGAFSAEALKNIKTVMVDNGKESTTDGSNVLITPNKFVCNNTQDKIFLLSEREITEKKYGFNKNDVRMTARIRKVTDYSKAAGVYTKFENNGYWWLRSPGSNNYTYAVTDGSTYGLGHTYRHDTGIVPALSISF